MTRFRFRGRLALIAPASAIAETLLDDTLQRLSALGIDHWLGNHARSRYRYLAGSNEQRLEDLNAALTRPDIDAIWCLRGGYGCAQLLAGIDWDAARRARPRPLIGFSDVSILLAALHSHGLPAIHAVQAGALGLLPDADPRVQHQRQEALDSLAALLENASGQLPAQAIGTVPERVDGVLLGGNLTALASLCGTAGALRLTQPSILILEDVGEPYYRLERSLCQLLDSLDTALLSAICLGTFEDCPRRGVVHGLEDIIQEHLAARGIPLFDGLPVGHGSANQAWPVGRQASLEDGWLRW